MSDSTEVDVSVVEPVVEAAPVQEPPELPGRHLREAREARGLSVADVAQVLKFSPRQIETLEADELTALAGGTTFIRGFIRSYAKFLRLDSAPLIMMIEAQVPLAPPDVRPPQNMGAAMPPSAMRQIPLLVAAALLVAAVTVGAWHFLGVSGSMRAVTGDGRSVEPAIVPEPVSQPQARIEQSDGTDAGTKTVSAMPSPDDRQLVFVLQEKAWIEVRDAGQQILFTGEYPAGSRQALMGKPPLHLVIGNAARVGLSFDGRPVDLVPHIRADVARLTIE
ncbi:MAG: DUF4115 domain-containing protein [Rhodocyclaceae bacterium]|nr:DUF4115 domain-containing protein [Rhodocyclaceae bacterium]